MEGSPADATFLFLLFPNMKFIFHIFYVAANSFFFCRKHLNETNKHFETSVLLVRSVYLPVLVVYVFSLSPQTDTMIVKPTHRVARSGHLVLTIKCFKIF